MVGTKWIWRLLHAFGILLAIFLVLPSLIVIPISFSDSALLKFPPQGFSLRWYVSFFESPAWTDALLLSCTIGIGTMFVATLLGSMAALGLVRGEFPGKNVLHGFLLSPMIVPFVITALAMYYFYSELKMVGNAWSLLLSHICLATPIVVVIVSATLQDFDRQLEQAAQILGATPLQAFIKITFPIIRPGVISGALFSFIISFDEVVVAAFIGGYRSATLPKRMFDNVRDEMDPTVAAISTILVALSVCLLIIMAVIKKRSETRPGGA
jgi:putative spermidine/putrescine transport system permease protein